MTPLTPGQILDGKYRVERVLGGGGMGVVVEATHLPLDARVALKLLAPGARLADTATARLVREARAMAKLGGEHIARVLDVGAFSEAGPYIALELLDGRDLGRLARERGPLPIVEATGYVVEACEGVGRAHALGIVHRDLKPSNLFVARDAAGVERVKVLDFGLSKLVEGALNPTHEPRLTATGALLGSPVYMSPEQIADPRTVDVRADVWSLGVILYELLTGRFPFEGATLPQICTLILHGRPAAISKRRADVPPELAAIVGRCLAKDPASRFADARVLAAALAPFAPARATPNGGPWRVSPRLFALIGIALVGVALATAALAVSQAGHRPPSEGGTTSASASTGSPCAACVASSCGLELEACQANGACVSVLASYDACVTGAAASSGAACAERLGTDTNGEAQRLAACVFVRVGGATLVPGRCADACTGRVLGGDACVGYCSCMHAACEATLSSDNCPALCATFTPEQVRCRTFHCALAGQTRSTLHCEHALGRQGACP